MKYLFLCLLLLSACTKEKAEIIIPETATYQGAVTAPGTVTDIKAELIRAYNFTSEWPNKAWTDLTTVALSTHGDDLLKTAPKDFNFYCNKKFENLFHLERIQFYTTLISALAKYESSYNPKATYTENFKDAKGNFVVSAGLLQISIESGKAYGCPLKATSDLFDPGTNIACGVRIMNRWVGQRDKGIYPGKNLGAGRYWSPFRKDTRRAAIALKTKALPFCK